MAGLEVDALHHPGAGEFWFGLRLRRHFQINSHLLDSHWINSSLLNRLLLNSHWLRGHRLHRGCDSGARFGVGLLVSDLHAQQPPKPIGQRTTNNGNQNTGEHSPNS